MNLNHLILLIFFFTYKIETGKIRPNFDAIFGDGWNKKGSEKYIKNEQNDQNKENKQMDGEIANEPIDQMTNYHNSMENDQNAKKKLGDQQKIETIEKFERIKEKLKEKGKYKWENRSKIETKIGKLLGESRKKIYKWKKELNLNKIKTMKKYEEKKTEFIERFGEFKSLYGQRKQKEFVKELGISYETFRRWKKELMPNYHKKHNTNEDKFRKMKQHFEMKEGNQKITEQIIAKNLGLGLTTLKKWKKKFASISDM